MQKHSILEGRKDFGYAPGFDIFLTNFNFKAIYAILFHVLK